MTNTIGLTLDPERAQRDPQWAQGELIRSQWDLFTQRYRPLEENAIAQINRDIEPEVDRAGDTVRGFYSIADGMQERNAARFGLNQSADTRAVSRRRSGLQQALDVAGTKNNLRREWEDTRMDKLGEMLGIGKGIAGTSLESMGTAAGLASARQQAGDSARASARAQEMQLLGSLGGLGLALAFSL
jgi:hypothetical protein